MGTPNVLADRVLVATTTAGTATYSLGPAIAGYLDPASAGVPSGSRVPYVVVDSLTSPTRMEVAEGVYTAGSPSTLTRATIRRNTAGGTSAESWAAGTKYIMFAPNAAVLPTLETDGSLAAPGVNAGAAGITSGAAIVANAGDIVALAGAFFSTLAGAPTQGQISLGNAGYRLFCTGTNFDLNGSLAVTGSVTASGNLIWLSDAAGKEDIKPARLGLREALRMSPVTFRRKASKRRARRELGVIAQDVQAAHPLAVHTTEDGSLAVSAAGVDAILLGAVRDLAAELETLRARIRALEGGGNA